MDTETEAVLTQPYKEISYKMNLLLKTGELLVRSGADTSRITRNMLRAASYMGIPKNRIHYHITYTTLCRCKLCMWRLLYAVRCRLDCFLCNGHCVIHRLLRA